MQRLFIGIALFISSIIIDGLVHAQAKRVLVFATDQSIPQDTPERRAINPEMSARAEKLLVEMVKSFHKTVHGQLLRCDINAFYAYLPAEGGPPLSLLPVVLESSNATQAAVISVDNRSGVRVSLQYISVERGEGSSAVKPLYRVKEELLNLSFPIDFTSGSPPLSNQVDDAAHAAAVKLCSLDRGSPKQVETDSSQETPTR